MDRFCLDGRVAVVTGSSSGLGVTFARALAEAGADLVLGARRVERLVTTEGLVRSVGKRVISAATDVTIPADCDRLVQLAIEEFGHVDVLVNNAGAGSTRSAFRETPNEFTQIIEVNLYGCYWMAQASARVMQPGSSIINVSSVLATTTAGLPQAAYSSSKAALLGLTRDLAQQWSGRGIRVNALQPGLFASEMTQHFRPELVERLLGRIPLGRVGDVDELAAAVVFLASEASSYITGISLPVDGGFLIT